MKHLQALLISAAMLAGSTAHANDAQRHFLDFSINLGWAAAAVEIHGDIPIVTASINRAIAHFNAGEAMIGPPYAGERRRLTQLRRRLSDYARATSRMSRRGKSTYLRNIWFSYRDSLSVIYRTEAGRQQFKKRTTCDSHIAQVGYDFGRAQIYAGHPPSRGRKSTAIQSMKQAIRNGLRVSFDGYPSRSRRDDKLCCSFGSADSWTSMLNLRMSTRPEQFDRYRDGMQRVVTRARMTCDGGSPGQVAHSRDRRRPRGGHDGPPPRHPDGPRTGHDGPRGTAGTDSFKTSWGTMTFNGRTSGVLATYTTDNGRVVGTRRGGVFRAYWVEKHSARRCKTLKDGSYYWGRADFEIRGDRITGKWGYCNNTPTRSWSGTRNRRVIKR